MHLKYKQAKFFMFNLIGMTSSLQPNSRNYDVIFVLQPTPTLLNTITRLY